MFTKFEHPHRVTSLRLIILGLLGCTLVFTLCGSALASPDNPTERSGISRAWNNRWVRRAVLTSAALIATGTPYLQTGRGQTETLPLRCGGSVSVTTQGSSWRGWGPFRTDFGHEIKVQGEGWQRTSVKRSGASAPPATPQEAHVVFSGTTPLRGLIDGEISGLLMGVVHQDTATCTVTTISAYNNYNGEDYRRIETFTLTE